MTSLFRIDQDLNIVCYDKAVRHHFPPKGKYFELEIDGIGYSTSVRNLRSGCTSVAKTYDSTGNRISRINLCYRHRLAVGMKVNIEVIVPFKKYQMRKSITGQDIKPISATIQTAKEVNKTVVSNNALIELYISSLEKIIKLGWAYEVRENRERAPLGTVGRTKFFNEYSFCVFAAFFRWSIVHTKWPKLTEVFRGWDYEEIYKNRDKIRQQAMEIIANKNKVNAILKCSERLYKEGWDQFKADLLNADLSEQLKKLDNLPGIGEAAKYQLAGAIGIDIVAKPDRYLLDFASKYGYPRTEEGVQDFAKRIAHLVGERIKVVDYVLWRCAEGSTSAA